MRFFKPRYSTETVLTPRGRERGWSLRTKLPRLGDVLPLQTVSGVKSAFKDRFPGIRYKKLEIALGSLFFPYYAESEFMTPPIEALGKPGRYEAYIGAGTDSWTMAMADVLLRSLVVGRLSVDQPVML